MIVILAVAALLATAAPPAAPEAHEAAALLERSRREAHAERFDGVVRVQWRANGEERTALVAVRSTARGVEVGGGDAPTLIGHGSEWIVRAGNSWQALWGAEVDRHPPVLAKYELALLPSTPVAGRPCRVIEARRGGHVRERLFVDPLSGLLLRREQIDPAGHVERAVEFVSLDEATSAPDPAVPASRSAHTVAARGFDTPYRIVRRPGAGYALLGTFRERDHVVHALYGDGLHGLSVFEQRGRLDRRRLPRGGADTVIGGHRVVLYELPAGRSLVWAGDGVVYTVVTDAPMDDIEPVVGRFPHGSRVNRIVQAARRFAVQFRWR